MENALFVLAVVGIVELTKLVRAKEWGRVFTVITAGVVGVILAIFHKEVGLPSFSIIEGIIGGFAGSGLVTTGQYLGRKDTEVKPVVEPEVAERKF